jgi:hypothetical protein
VPVGQNAAVTFGNFADIDRALRAARKARRENNGAASRSLPAADVRPFRLQQSRSGVMKHQRAWLLHSTSWQARNTRSEMLRGVCMRRVAAVLSMLIVVSLIALQMLIVLPSAARPIPQLMVTPRPTPPKTPVGYLPVIVDARPTAVYAPTITPCPTPTEVPNLAQFVNADFEQGHIGWTEIPSTTIIAQLTGHLAHSGQWVAWLGGDKGNTDVVSQTITLPTGSPLYLRFYYFVPDSSIEPDYMIVRANGTHLFGFPIYVPTSWESATINISQYAGQTISLQFEVSVSNKSQSSIYVDDVHISSRP